MEKYDVFISYRREGGYDTAKHLYDLLTRDGYRVSFDIDTLRNGDFDTQLYKRIDSCTDFLLVVDQHAFDRTIKNKIPRDKDWLRCELAYALHKNKNIIPIFLTGITKFPDNLPNDIVSVIKKNGPEYNRYYFDEFYRTLRKRFLHDKRNVWKKLLVVIFSVCLTCFVFFIIIKIPNNNGYIGSGKLANNGQLPVEQCPPHSNKNRVEVSSKTSQSSDSVIKENTDKNILGSDKRTSGASQTDLNSNVVSVEKPIHNKKTSSKKSSGLSKEEVSKEVKTQTASTEQNGSFRVYDIDELMKLAASGDSRAYVPLAKYYYRNASGILSYENVHIYSMKAINANVDVVEAKKLINDIDALGFYRTSNKFKKPNF